MAIQGLPTFTLPGEELAKAPAEMQTILSKILEGKQKQQELDQTNKYHMGMLGVEQQKLPLQMKLLESKIKESNKNSQDELTKSSITRNQSIVQAVDNTSPMIDDLINSEFPGQTIGKYYHPSGQAEYDAKVATITDSLVAALGLPKTDTSLALVQQIVRQKPFELRSAYIKRMEKLKDDLHGRKERAVNALKTHTVLNNGNENTEEKPAEEKTSKTEKNWKVVNGKLVEA